MDSEQTEEGVPEEGVEGGYSRVPRPLILPILEPEPEPAGTRPEPFRVSRGIIPKGLMACRQCGAHIAYADVEEHECALPPTSAGSRIGREEPLSKELWVPDEYVERCEASGCKRVFSLAVGKHHCRCCGRIFCKACSGEKAEFAQPWQWQTDRGLWKKFAPSDQDILNEADASGQRTAHLAHGQYAYTFDFDARVQRNDQTGKERALQGGAGLVTNERVCNGCHADLNAGGGTTVAAASEWQRAAKWEVLIDQGWTSYDSRQSQELEMAYQYDQPSKEISTPERESARNWRYRVELHTMVQHNLTHEARKMRAVRRTGPSGKLHKLLQQQRKCVSVEPLHRHQLRNECGETLVLQPLGKFASAGHRWLEPPPGLIAPGEQEQWTSTGPPCDVTYLMRDSRAEVVLRLGPGTTYHGFIVPHHSNPKAKADEKLPQLRCSRAVGVGLGTPSHEWVVTPSRVEQPLSSAVGGSAAKQHPSWLPMRVAPLETVGLGSTHLAISWVVSTLAAETHHLFQHA